MPCVAGFIFSENVRLLKGFWMMCSSFFAQMKLEVCHGGARTLHRRKSGQSVDLVELCSVFLGDEK